MKQGIDRESLDSKVKLLIQYNLDNFLESEIGRDVRWFKKEVLPLVPYLKDKSKFQLVENDTNGPDFIIDDKGYQITCCFNGIDRLHVVTDASSETRLVLNQKLSIFGQKSDCNAGLNIDIENHELRKFFIDGSFDECKLKELLKCKLPLKSGSFDLNIFVQDISVLESLLDSQSEFRIKNLNRLIKSLETSTIKYNSCSLWFENLSCRDNELIENSISKIKKALLKKANKPYIGADVLSIYLHSDLDINGNYGDENLTKKFEAKIKEMLSGFKDLPFKEIHIGAIIWRFEVKVDC